MCSSRRKFDPANREENNQISVVSRVEYSIAVDDYETELRIFLEMTIVIIFQLVKEKFLLLILLLLLLRRRREKFSPLPFFGEGNNIFFQVPGRKSSDTRRK